MLTRTTPPGFILPVTLGSLLTTLSGQLGFQLAQRRSCERAAGTVSGSAVGVVGDDDLGAEAATRRS